jgi:hypothetical protein
MSDAKLFLIGFVACIPTLLAVFAVMDWVERQIRKRHRFPAANAVRMFDARLEAGERISVRNLLGWRLPGERSYVLALFKQGPNEPGAERPANPPFTEPLDDEESATNPGESG